MDYIDLFIRSFQGYGAYLWHSVTHPGLHNYFYGLIAISLVVYATEIAFPWRKRQARIRQDFWLDAFYMFFNFFLFSLVGYAAISEVGVRLFHDGLAAVGIENLVAIEVSSLPTWAQLLTLFLVRDFIHWNVHRLLHRVPALWEFHKVHHSVIEMGFAAHLRYHWMENVVYRTLEYIPMAMIGFGIDDFMLVHFAALTVGHVNHANVRVPLGPLKYVFNNPQMHIWHHVKEFPAHSKYGVNFGISLSVWDYLFGSAYLPADGRDIELGFAGVETFPRSFLAQVTYSSRPSRQDPRL